MTDIAFSRAGWKYYFLFIFFDLFAVVVMYFFFIETKKRTLEELTAIFRSPNPVKASLQSSEALMNQEELQTKRGF